MRNLRSTVLTAATAAAVVFLVSGVQPSAEQAKPAANAPAFKVDPTWPLEMPNNWILGSVTGVFVDASSTCGCRTCPRP